LHDMVAGMLEALQELLQIKWVVLQWQYGGNAWLRRTAPLLSTLLVLKPPHLAVRSRFAVCFCFQPWSRHVRYNVNHRSAHTAFAGVGSCRCRTAPCHNTVLRVVSAPVVYAPPGEEAGVQGVVLEGV
jgi:hypothetical protein